VKTGLLEQ